MVVAQQEVRTVEVWLKSGGSATFENVEDATFHDGALKIDLTSGDMILYAPGAWTTMDLSPPRTVRAFL